MCLQVCYISYYCSKICKCCWRFDFSVSFIAHPCTLAVTEVVPEISALLFYFFFEQLVQRFLCVCVCVFVLFSLWGYIVRPWRLSEIDWDVNSAKLSGEGMEIGVTQLTWSLSRFDSWLDTIREYNFGKIGHFGCFCDSDVHSCHFNICCLNSNITLIWTNSKPDNGFHTKITPNTNTVITYNPQPSFYVYESCFFMWLLEAIQAIMTFLMFRQKVNFHLVFFIHIICVFLTPHSTVYQY